MVRRASPVRPGWVSTVAVLFVCVVTARLGVWQLSRFQERSAIADQREARHAQPALTAIPVDRAGLDFRRVRLEGRFRAFEIATGGVPYSRNGYAALGVFEAGSESVVVLRGWVPAEGFERWLDGEGSFVVEGVLRESEDAGSVAPIAHPSTGRRVWPLEREAFLGVLSRGVRLPIRSIAAAHGAVEEVYVVAGPELADLEDRDPLVLPAGGYTTYLKTFHHLEYAVQWFAFAGIALGLWLWFGWRRARRTPPA